MSGDCGFMGGLLAKVLDKDVITTCSTAHAFSTSDATNY